MLIAWRDHVKDPATAFAIGGDFTAIDNPDRLKNRRLASKATIHVTGPSDDGILEIMLPTPRPIRLVALLAHSLNTASMRCLFYDESSTLINAGSPLATGVDVWLPPAGSGIPRNLFLTDGVEYQGVKSIQLVAFVNQPSFTIGRLWAGPAWSPKHGMHFDETSFDVEDPSRVVESQGGQAYSTPRQKRRSARIRLSAATEAEFISTSADPNGQSLQALRYEAGDSEPLLFIPSTAGATDAERQHLIHRLGGYFRCVRSGCIQLRNATADSGTRTRIYQWAADLVEEL